MFAPKSLVGILLLSTAASSAFAAETRSPRTLEEAFFGIYEETTSAAKTEEHCDAGPEKTADHSPRTVEEAFQNFFSHSEETASNKTPAPRTLEEAFFGVKEEAKTEAAAPANAKTESREVASAPPAPAVKHEEKVEVPVVAPAPAPAPAHVEPVAASKSEDGSVYEEVSKVMPVEKKGDGYFINVKSGAFARASYTVGGEYREKLLAIGKIFAKHPQMKFVIEGHTDDEGTEERNDVLSVRRALAVRNVFLQAGVTRDHMNALGYGSRIPASEDKTAEGRSLNRRVEIKFEK